MQHIVQNMAQSSVIEYEIGLLVSQALDRVGDLVTLDIVRGEMHTVVAKHHPESFDDTPSVQSALKIALYEAFCQHKATTSDGQSITLPLHQSCSGTVTGLTTRQLQELGAAFGRDPSDFRLVVGAMWDSGDPPDVSSIVTPSSPLATFY